jgi:hypothetical protein
VRRRRPQSADSLELLLDTLCNTFGGVLFIAMLVVVLLQMAGKGASGHPREPVRSEDLLDLADELEVLGREVESLARGVPDKAPRGGDVREDALGRLAKARERLDELRRRKDAKLVDTGRHDAAALAFDEEVAGLEERREQAKREAEGLREQIEKERKAHTRVVHTPVMHPTVKPRLAVELRYDRLYVVHSHDATGGLLGPNLDEYVLLAESGDEVQVTADPGRGMPVKPGPGLVPALRRRLARFPPGRYVLDLAVRAGSFGSFHALKVAANGAGYEMRVLLVSEDGSFADRGGTRSDVQ